MDILHTYTLFKEIKNADTAPSFFDGDFYKRYTLQTQQYTIVAGATSYGRILTKYDVAAHDKTKNRTRYYTGVIAKIMFSKIYEKANQK